MRQPHKAKSQGDGREHTPGPQHGGQKETEVANAEKPQLEENIWDAA